MAVMGAKSYSKGKGGRRLDLENKYFRSRWEANYARYLNWLQEKKQIRGWDYEPDTFEFHHIKRGSRFYTPDFRVEHLDGFIEYHEVKGWLDPKSVTKLKRMSRCYPDIKVKLIRQKEMRVIAKQVSAMLSMWEKDKKRGAFG